MGSSFPVPIWQTVQRTEAGPGFPPAYDRKVGEWGNDVIYGLDGLLCLRQAARIGGAREERGGVQGGGDCSGPGWDEVVH
jgi:hypothetical protein